MRSNPINPEFATLRGRNAVAVTALVAALLLHGILAWVLLQQTVVVQNKPPVFNVEMIRLPKPVAAVKLAVKTPKAVPKTIVHVSPAPLAHIKIHGPAKHATRHMVAPAPRIMHFNAANANTGLGMDLATPDAGTGIGSLAAFNDSVNGRIGAMSNYPPGLPPAYGLKFWNQCVIDYHLKIASNGALISYELYGHCNNPFLEAATRADILLAAPYPPPPNFGGSAYDVYGSKVFKKPQ